MSISVTYESEYKLIIPYMETRTISPISTSGTINKFEITDYPSSIPEITIKSSTGVINLEFPYAESIKTDFSVSGSITVKISNDTTSKSFTFNIYLYYIPCRFFDLLQSGFNSTKYFYTNSNLDIEVLDQGGEYSGNYSGNYIVNFYNLPEDISVTTVKNIGGEYNITLSGNTPSSPCIYYISIDVTYTPANFTETFQCDIHIVDPLVFHYNDYTCYLGDTVEITPIIESGGIYQAVIYNIYDTDEQDLGNYKNVFSNSITIERSTGKISGVANREGTFNFKIGISDEKRKFSYNRFNLNIINNYCVNCTNCTDCFYCTDCIDCNNCNSCTTCIACNTCSNCSNCSNCRDCVNVT